MSLGIDPLGAAEIALKLGDATGFTVGPETLYDDRPQRASCRRPGSEYRRTT
jgi:hypothetical protein